MWSVLRLVAAACVLAAGLGQAQTPGAKLALVIGVGDYARDAAVQQAGGFVAPPRLVNATGDAALIADALASKGFTVTRTVNPDRRAMLTAINAFSAALAQAGPDAVGVFYFAGHGAQGRPALERDIDNYLIPLGTSLTSEIDLESEAIGLSRISEKLRPGAGGATVIILDACRDFALPASRGLAKRGLAETRAAPGTMIAYATAPGAEALDVLPGQANGPYATALAGEVRGARGATLEQLFIAVRNKVLDDTHNTQVPWENSSLRRTVTFGVAPAVSLATPHLDVPGPVVFDSLMRLDLTAIAGYLRQGWDPNSRLDPDGNAALHDLMLLCERDPGHNKVRLAAMASNLIQGGASTTLRNKWGDTALTIAKSPRYCGPDHPIWQVID